MCCLKNSAQMIGTQVGFGTTGNDEMYSKNGENRRNAQCAEWIMNSASFYLYSSFTQQLVPGH